MSDNYSDEQPKKSGIDSPNATQFYASDANQEKQRKFERLWFYNENLRRDRNNTNSTEVRRREQSHILDAISSSLELPDYQHDEAKKIVHQTDFTEDVQGRYLSIETYCFAICVLIHNKYVNIFKNKHLPEKTTESNPDFFIRLQDEMNISENELSQALDELKNTVTGYV